MLHEFHAAAVGGDRGFEFELAIFHAVHEVLEFGQRGLEFHVDDRGLIHINRVRGNNRKYPIRGLQVKFREG